MKSITSQRMRTTFDEAGYKKLDNDKKEMEVNKEKMKLIVGEMER